jgi:hypothetical protein
MPNNKVETTSSTKNQETCKVPKLLITSPQEEIETGCFPCDIYGWFLWLFGIKKDLNSEIPVKKADIKSTELIVVHTGFSPRPTN